MEVFRVGAVGKKVLQKALIAVFPMFGIRWTAHPTFFLEELQKDQTAQQPFNEVADRLFGFCGALHGHGAG
jgi:hypothetical protein